MDETKGNAGRAARYLSRSRKRKKPLNNVLQSHDFEEENEDNKKQKQQSSEEDEAPLPDQKASPNIPGLSNNSDENEVDAGINFYDTIDLGDLVTNQDRNLVSDAMFLAMSQLQIYHATEETSTPSSSLSSRKVHDSKPDSSAATATANSRGHKSVVGLQCRHCANQQQQPRKKRMRSASTAAPPTTQAPHYSKKNALSLSSYTYFPTSAINLSQISFLHTILHHFIHKCHCCPVEIHSELQKALRNTKDIDNDDGDHSPPQQWQEHDRHFIFYERIWSRMHDTATNNNNTNDDAVVVRNSASLPFNKHYPIPPLSTARTRLRRISPRRHNNLLAKLDQIPHPRRILIPITEGCSGMELSLITATLSKFDTEVVVATDSMPVPPLPSTLHGDTSNNIRVKLKEGHYLRVPMTLEVALSICQDDGWNAILLPTSSSFGDKENYVLGTSSFSPRLIELLQYHNLLEKPIGITGMSPKTIIEALPHVLKLDEPQPRSTTMEKLTKDGNSSASAISDSSMKDKERLSNHHDSYKDILVENNVVVSRGMGVAQLLALQIGEMLYNREMADCVAKEMLMSRVISHRQRKQPQEQLVHSSATPPPPSPSNHESQSSASSGKMDASSIIDLVSTTSSDDGLEENDKLVDSSVSENKDHGVGRISPGEKDTVPASVTTSNMRILSTEEDNDRGNQSKDTRENTNNKRVDLTISDDEDLGIGVTTRGEKDTVVVDDKTSNMQNLSAEEDKDEGNQSKDIREYTDDKLSAVSSSPRNEGTLQRPATQGTEHGNSSASTLWDGMLQRLEKHIGFSISTLSKKNHVLGKWAYEQRRNKDKLPGECKRRLDNLGFKWSDSDRDESCNDSSDDGGNSDDSSAGTKPKSHALNGRLRKKKIVRKNHTKKCTSPAKPKVVRTRASRVKQNEVSPTLESLPVVETPVQNHPFKNGHLEKKKVVQKNHTKKCTSPAKPKVTRKMASSVKQNEVSPTLESLPVAETPVQNHPFKNGHLEKKKVVQKNDTKKCTSPAKPKVARKRASSVKQNEVSPTVETLPVAETPVQNHPFKNGHLEKKKVVQKNDTKKCTSPAKPKVARKRASSVKQNEVSPTLESLPVPKHKLTRTRASRVKPNEISPTLQSLPVLEAPVQNHPVKNQEHQTPQSHSPHKKGKVRRARLNSKMFSEIVARTLVEECGWRVEQGTRSADRYYLPPGVERGKGSRCRHDYYDSSLDVVKHIEMSDDSKAKAAYQQYLIRSKKRNPEKKRQNKIA